MQGAQLSYPTKLHLGACYPSVMCPHLKTLEISIISLRVLVIFEVIVPCFYFLLNSFSSLHGAMPILMKI